MLANGKPSSPTSISWQGFADKSLQSRYTFSKLICSRTGATLQFFHTPWQTGNRSRVLFQTTHAVSAGGSKGMIAPQAPGWRPCTAPASRHTSPAPLTPCRSDWGACFFSSCLFLFVLSPSFFFLRAYSALSSRLAIIRASHIRYLGIDVPCFCLWRYFIVICLKGIAVRPLLYAKTQSGRWSGATLGYRQNMRATILGIPKGLSPFGRRRQILNTTFYRSGGFPYAFCE